MRYHRSAKLLEYELSRAEVGSVGHLSRQERQRHESLLSAEQLSEVFESVVRFQSSLDSMKRVDLMVILDYLTGNSC